MYNITVGRYDADPEAQGVIKPQDDSWQLVIDKDGYPHLYVRCKLESDNASDPKDGLLCVEDMLVDGLTIPALMQGTFGGKLSPEDEEKALEEHLARKKETGIPCPR
jgi:hypothetical protein